MTIQEKTVWVTMGKQFDSEEKAVQFRDDQVGMFLNNAPITIHPGDWIKLAKYVCERRKQLAKLLEY